MAGAVGDRYTVMGDVVNVAARLQAAGRPAASRSVRSTHRASREAISYERLEPLILKGKEEPVPAWEATEVISVPGRAARRSETPLIGRAEEAELLVSLVERVERESAPSSGDRHRPGRSRQVAPAARAHRHDRLRQRTRR